MRNLVLMCQGACKRKELFSVIRMSETQGLVDWMAVLSKIEFSVCLELLHFLISLPREFPGARYEIRWQGGWNETGFAVGLGIASVLQCSGGIMQHKRALCGALWSWGRILVWSALGELLESAFCSIKWRCNIYLKDLGRIQWNNVSSDSVTSQHSFNQC